MQKHGLLAFLYWIIQEMHMTGGYSFTMPDSTYCTVSDKESLLPDHPATARTCGTSDAQ